MAEIDHINKYIMMGDHRDTNTEHSEIDEELIDIFCNPDNPVVIPFQEVSAAAYRIKGGIEKTPCEVRTVRWSARGDKIRSISCTFGMFFFGLGGHFPFFYVRIRPIVMGGSVFCIV